MAWIRETDEKKEELLWTLIGGKFIEFFSCVFLVVACFWLRKRIKLLRSRTAEYYSVGSKAPGSRRESGEGSGASTGTSEGSGSLPLPAPLPQVPSLPMDAKDAPCPHCYHHPHPSEDVVAASNELRSLETKLLIMPLIFVLLRFPGNLGIVLYYASVPVPGAIHVFQALCDPLQGFANMVIFVLTSETERNLVIKILMRRCSCYRKSCQRRRRGGSEPLMAPPDEAGGEAFVFSS